MKSVKQVLLVIASFVVISFFASEVAVGQAASDGGTYMEANVGDDLSFKVVGDESCVAFDWGNGEFGIYGVVDFDDLENTEGVVMAFNGDLKPGDYPLISDNSTAKYMVYYTGGKGKKRYTSFSEKGGTLTIKAVDEKYVSGTFSYQGIDRAEETLPVTGSFKVLITKI